LDVPPRVLRPAAANESDVAPSLRMAIDPVVLLITTLI
jgi:hypothetical protein